jgi:hypothetical protein
MFNVVGDTIVVRGVVTRKWLEDDRPDIGYLELEMTTEGPRGITVGPGSVVVTLPRGSK